MSSRREIREISMLRTGERRPRMGFAFFGLYVVKQQTNVIIERLGKYSRTDGPGIHFFIPIIERRAAIVSLRTSQTKFNIDAKTSDNVTITMEIAAQYHVSTAIGKIPEENGVYKSFYRLQNPVEQMKAYLVDGLRSSIPKYSLDDVFAKKDDIASDVNVAVQEKMYDYGYELVSTLITAISLPKDVEESMNRINSAQREKEAAKSLAEAEKIKVVVEAQAQAEAMEQAGIGIANQRKAIAVGISDSLDKIKESGVSTAEANQLFLFTQWADMMQSFAKQNGVSTVVLPSDFNQTASMFDQILVSQKVGEKSDK